MRVNCNLRRLRGSESLRSVAQRAGVSSGVLSQIEQGRALPRDRDLARLEAAYGAPITDWYSPRTLLAITEDEET